VFESNVLEGARLALTLDPDPLLLEGSGAALPPVMADRTVCVTGAGRDALSYLGPYRLLCSDLVVVLGAERLDRRGRDELRRALSDWIEPEAIVACALEAEPLGELPPGARVAFFSTSDRARLGQDIDVRVSSPNLARRDLLEADLARAAKERCDVYLTELKAAAIELVAEEAERRGARIEFVRNRPQPLAGEPDLDEQLGRIYDEARA